MWWVVRASNETNPPSLFPDIIPVDFTRGKVARAAENSRGGNRHDRRLASPSAIVASNYRHVEREARARARLSNRHATFEYPGNIDVAVDIVRLRVR